MKIYSEKRKKRKIFLRESHGISVPISIRIFFYTSNEIILKKKKSLTFLPEGFTKLYGIIFVKKRKVSEVVSLILYFKLIFNLQGDYN